LLSNNALVRSAGPLWDDATRPPFLAALAAGTLAADSFPRWLAQDYLFAKSLVAFQAILTAKAPRDCHKVLIQGLVALDRELEWFEAHAARLAVSLDLPPHRICRRYADFLLRCAYTEPAPVLLAILFGVEASYLAAWSTLPVSGPYAEFIERWSSAAFGEYVAGLAALSARHPHPAAQEHFNQVLAHEHEFWKMSAEG
jgi:formylaminopyrimidine deformylase / aminopyrimidine aminohydrolase